MPKYFYNPNGDDGQPGKWETFPVHPDPWEHYKDLLKPYMAQPKSPTVTREALAAILEPAVELILRKNHDYGNSWARQGLPGVLTRLADKFYRFENLANGAEALITDERIEDTLQDGLAYCLLGLLYIREDRDGTSEL